MIKPGEVQQKARVAGVRDQQIEKDYVLSWILKGIAGHKDLSTVLIFKGSTVLRKMRSVMQRMQARDFYDLWYLLEVENMKVDFYINEFRVKCESKGLRASDFLQKLSESLPQYKGRWNSSLREQIQDLPNFEKAERETCRHLKKITF